MEGMERMRNPCYGKRQDVQDGHAIPDGRRAIMLLRGMRFRRGDTAVARREIRAIAGTVPAGAVVEIISADPILRCYDIAYRGMEITECSDRDLDDFG